MKRLYLFLLPLLILENSCKEKNNDPEKKFISVVSFIKEQIAHVDTALYSITKYVTIDTLHTDTSYVVREDFRKQATEFLDIPDLSNKKNANRYNENVIYDETINRVIITYTPKEPEKEEYKKQEFLITPNSASGDKVNNIIIIREAINRNGLLRKNMLWQMNKSFQIVTTTQLPGEPEKMTTTKVTWNEDKDE